jgi:dynein heavy chain
MDGNFELLNAEEIEENLIDWWKSLARLSKTHLAEYYHPINLLNYLFNQLEEFKVYLPMITALRTKGITERHWK